MVTVEEVKVAARIDVDDSDGQIEGLIGVATIDLKYQISGDFAPTEGFFEDNVIFNKAVLYQTVWLISTAGGSTQRINSDTTPEPHPQQVLNWIRQLRPQYSKYVRDGDVVD